MDLPVPPQGSLTNCMPAELLASPAFLLVRIGHAIKIAAFDEFERADFSPYHYSILALLDEGARTTQGAIADALALDRSQLVGLLDGLEERGLIERRRDEGDRRRHVVTLTPGGHQQLRAFRTVVGRMEDEFLAPLDDHDRTTLHALLSQLAARIDPRYVRELGPPVAPR
jgi:MarR family transcriptional regulator, lower aerobic nicotinate degradation pathway regulator